MQNIILGEDATHDINYWLWKSLYLKKLTSGVKDGKFRINLGVNVQLMISTKEGLMRS